MIGGQVWVTDDYGAYRNIFEKHQLCWGHPLRKFRDLKDSPSLTKEQTPQCTKTYEAFAELYAKLTKILLEENTHYGITKEWRMERIAKKEKKLREAFQKVSIIHKKDPKKLRTLKESLQKNEDVYFTCLQ